MMNDLYYQSGIRVLSSTLGRIRPAAGAAIALTPAESFSGAAIPDRLLHVVMEEGLHFYGPHSTLACTFAKPLKCFTSNLFYDYGDHAEE